jgi:hypothetical protein
MRHFEVGIMQNVFSNHAELFVEILLPVDSQFAIIRATRAEELIDVWKWIILECVIYSATILSSRKDHPEWSKQRCCRRSENVGEFMC